MIGQQAIVIGAGITGLAAARALSDSFGQVMILERDQLPQDAGPRIGVPQGKQPHALLVGGQRALSEQFPQFVEQLLKARDRRVVKAIAFAIDRDDQKQRQFQNILRAIGFEVKLKPFIRRSDGSAKGDWDVGITLDVMEYAPQVDVVTLASGDGDFDTLVNKIREQHRVSVEVYGVSQLTAESLRRAATKFIPISDRLLLGERK